MNSPVGECLKVVKVKVLVSSMVLTVHKDKPTHVTRHKKWLLVLISLNTYVASA